MLQAVLFDLDGTLANTDPIHFVTWQHILRDYGLDIDLPFYQKHFSGRLNPDIIRDLLPHLSPAENEQLGIEKETRFRDNAQGQLKPLSGLLALIGWIGQQGLKTAIVTNAPRANAEFMLQTLNLTQIFATVILSETLPVGKPDPLPYQEALHRLKITPETALVFEDSPAGIRSAIAAGITTVGIASTHHPDELYELGVKLVVADFTDQRLQQLGIMS
ncbi:MAG: HAD family phosphatase [Cyanothece sp. SIO1E1]|nr:HAD family phosphatase [Cyanothece sp. SIO1E1]